MLDQATPPNGGVRVETRLAPEATPDVAAWQAAWRAIEADSVAALGRQLAGGADVRLTLCGPHRALTLRPGHGPAFKISSIFRPQRLSDLREQL